MGSLGDELSLGSICGSQRRVSKIMMNDEVEEHVKKVEEEKRKIKSWELELPLSLQLLNSEIVYLKEESKRCSEMNTQTLLKDLTREKANYDDHISKLERNDKESSMLLDPKVETDLGLSLTSSPIRRKEIVASGGSTSISMPQPQQPAFLQKQALRKQRRCWTPGLHRRFVDALQHLGGPGVATPKQIREHMKVEGLTNDEVKSHLQKYRLYIRKPNSNAEKQSEVVVGFKLWNSSQDEEETSEGGEYSNTNNLQSGSPQGPLQLLSTTTTTTGGDSNIEDAEQS